MGVYPINLNVSVESILKAKDKFLRTGFIDKRVVRQIIADSWIRSRDFYNIDPESINTSTYLDDAEYREKLDENEYLLRFSIPFLEKLIPFLREDGYVLVLYSKDGYHIYHSGELYPKEKRVIKLYEILKRVCWNEEYIGTSPFSLVKRLRSAVQVFGPEYYCNIMCNFCGSFAPIIVENNEFIGAIGITSYGKIPHPHTLGIAISAASAIENHIKHERVNERLRFYIENIRITLNSMKDGLVWTDENGKIIEINESAIEMLGIIGKDVKGKNVKDIVNSYPSLSDLIKSALSMKKVPSDEEIIVESIDGINRLITSITAVKIDGGEYIGTIISLKNIKSIKKIAKNIASYEAKFLLSDIVGNSKTIRELKEYVLLIARSDSNILIEGESGTGKELIAHCIHNYSDRSEGPFVPINCAAIPPELFESILFGYEKGAFTGAKAEGSHGKFEIANGGTLFLDEIGELPFHMQSKLLRAISEGRIEKIGGRRPINVDVRLISATNKSLLDEIDSGRFRKDLYYRINVFNIKTPSLREIIDDIPLLVEYFIKKSGKKIKYISEDFYNVLKAYSWPGNVRELENILERAIHTSKDGIIDINSLPEYIINNQEFLLPKKILPLSEIERNVIKMALDICKGNKSKSAKLLGIGRDTLYRKIRSYHI